jgi:hypothetical protein
MLNDSSDRKIAWARNLLNRLTWLISAHVAPAALFAAGSGGSQYSPTFSPGYLLACWICNGRKRNQIGGWLLYFYWQLYAGLVMSALFFAGNIQSYIPENFASGSTFALFLASTLPGLLLLVVKCVVATLLLQARSWDMLKLLRWLMLADLSADVLAAAIDGAYFPDNVALTFLSLVSDLIWLIYLFRSIRVRHVFLTHDWETAVDSLRRMHSGEVQWISSEALIDEINRNPNLERRLENAALLNLANETIQVDQMAASRAMNLEAAGYGAFDALHLACAEVAQVDVLLTTDDGFVRKASRRDGNPRMPVRNPVSWSKGNLP